MEQATSRQPLTVRREVRIGKTLFGVTSVYQGEQELKNVLLDWAVSKILQTPGPPNN